MPSTHLSRSSQEGARGWLPSKQRSWALAIISVVLLIAFFAVYYAYIMWARYGSIHEELKEAKDQIAALREKQTDLIIKITNIDNHLSLQTSSDAESLETLCVALKGKYN